jgi:hypothetical protein
VVWEHLEPDADEDDIRAEAVSEVQRDVPAASSVVVSQRDEDESGKTFKSFDVRLHKALLKEALQQHFAIAFRKGEVGWPKNMTMDQRSRVTIPPLQRAQNDLYASLYSKPSVLRVKGSNGQIGNGLFSSIRYNKDEDIVAFNGEFINYATYKARESAGVGGYMITIHFSADMYLDCYEQCKSFKCMASYANSPKNAINTITRSNARANCRLVVVVVSTQNRTGCEACLWMG